MSGSKKYSISLPETPAEAVRSYVGPGAFSAHVAEALEQRVAMDRLREIVADLGTDPRPGHPPPPKARPSGITHDNGRDHPARA